jgi:Helix-turn-helix domain
MSLTVDERPLAKPALTDAVGFVTEDVVCQVLGVPRRKTQRWREEGAGPFFYKFGQSIRYRLSEVLAWAETQRHAMTPPEYQRRPPASTSPAPIAAATAEQPAKRKRGWPKGKPRGPRKAPTSAAAE